MFEGHSPVDQYRKPRSTKEDLKQKVRFYWARASLQFGYVFMCEITYKHLRKGCLQYAGKRKHSTWRNRLHSAASYFIILTTAVLSYYFLYSPQTNKLLVQLCYVCIHIREFNRLYIHFSIVTGKDVKRT